jgi:hypothetical protein
MQYLHNKAEDEATIKKIYTLDNDVIEKYLYYREDEGFFFLGKRQLGSLGVRRKTNTAEKYNEDTALMRKILQQKLQEDMTTKKFIDTMDLPTVQDYINKRTKFTIFTGPTRLEGKLKTRTKLTNTNKNYKFDNTYLMNRERMLLNNPDKVKSLTRSKSHNSRNSHKSRNSRSRRRSRSRKSHSKRQSLFQF